MVLPDGSSFGIISINKKSFLKRWWHKLFHCPTFWRPKPAFTCPGCGKKYRCYWDGNDVTGVGIDFCNSCAADLEGRSNEAI